jgi:hypothetical protein
MISVIKDADRYLSNANEILEEKAIRDNGQYRDKKYIKMAGHTGCEGVLLALVHLIIQQNGIQKKQAQKSEDHYRAFLTMYDKELLSYFSDLYIVLHLKLGYDGVSDARIVKRGMAMAKEFIEKIAPRLN